MIEVELRGKFNNPSHYKKVKEFLTENGKHVETHHREMYLLMDYTGFEYDPLKRAIDLRLRNTDGNCEIMLKKKLSDNNISRKEISLKLQGNDLDAAKEIVKAFGAKRGIRMDRSKEIYLYKDIEWSLVGAPKENYYFEAEQEAQSESDFQKIQDHIEVVARELGLEIFSPEESRDYMYWMDKNLNTIVEF